MQVFPMSVFFFMGRRAGIIATVVVCLESLLLYILAFYHPDRNGLSYPIQCAEIRPQDAVVFIPNWCPANHVSSMLSSLSILCVV